MTVSKTNKHLLFFIAAAAVIFFGSKVLLNQALAYDINPDSSPSNPYQPAENLTSPITNFVDTVKQISIGIIPKTGVNLNAPQGIFDQVGDWFYGETGFHLGDILKKIGALLIYALTNITNFLKWATGQL